MLGAHAIPAWREFTAAPNVGPRARYALYAWGQGPEPVERDLQWLATESAAAALDGKGPDEALCVAWESVRAEDLAGRLAVMRVTCQPGSRSGTSTTSGQAGSTRSPGSVAYQGDSPVEYPSEENPRSLSRSASPKLTVSPPGSADESDTRRLNEATGLVSLMRPALA